MPYIRPKPTKYEGITYRSRLEARWAVFFGKLTGERGDTLFPSCFYEPTNFVKYDFGWVHKGDIENMPKEYHNISQRLTYTPDFILFSPFQWRRKKVWPLGGLQNIYVEIKPKKPNKEYFEMLLDLAEDTFNEILLLAGSPAKYSKNFYRIGSIKECKSDDEVSLYNDPKNAHKRPKGKLVRKWSFERKVTPGISFYPCPYCRLTSIHVDDHTELGQSSPCGCFASSLEQGSKNAQILDIDRVTEIANGYRFDLE